MARRRKQQQAPLLTLKDLEQLATTARNRLTSLEHGIKNYEERLSRAASRAIEIDRELAEIRSEAAMIQLPRRVGGLWGKLRKPAEGADSEYRRLEQLEIRRRDLEGELSRFQAMRALLESSKRELENARLEARMRENAAKSRRKRVEAERAEKRSVRKIKVDELHELRAAASRNPKEARKLGAAIRRKLERQPWCPYCGGSLGETPHADHIYPISKGGRSVLKNMVYVCESCNSRKRDRTLAGFIRKYKLDRDAIEDRLERLGKEY